MNQNTSSRCEKAIRVTDPSQTKPPQLFTGRKRYQIAQARNPNSRQHNDNLSLEISYFNVLARAKRLWKDSKQLAVERDFRMDKSIAYNQVMYAFITDSFYLFLECEFDYCYSLNFAFNDCPHEVALREMLQPLTSSFRVKEVSLKPDYATFYSNALAYQLEHFRYFL
ncbi:hypothetical protein ABIB62_003007 [Mucilaginibacter sp. UYP25]|uniref:hypothetical protein n=1 Tax=unclassified Mucilaginibacter TaxID=2617802 RepID=UPI0033921AE9